MTTQLIHCRHHGERPGYFVCGHVMLGDQISKHPELPQFLTCNHCLSVILKSAKEQNIGAFLGELLELTAMCDLCAAQRTLIPQEETWHG